MDDPAVTAKQLVDLARKHIEDQQCRIVRQRELVAKYERDDDIARLTEARRAKCAGAGLTTPGNSTRAVLGHFEVGDIVRNLFESAPIRSANAATNDFTLHGGSCSSAS